MSLAGRGGGRRERGAKRQSGGAEGRGHVVAHGARARGLVGGRLRAPVALRRSAGFDRAVRERVARVLGVRAGCALPPRAGEAWPYPSAGGLRLPRAFRADQVKTIDIGDSPSKGVPNAPVTIVEFADFECPACADKRPLLDKLVEQHSRKAPTRFQELPALDAPERGEGRARRRRRASAGQVLADACGDVREPGRSFRGQRRKARAKGGPGSRALPARSRQRSDR